MKYLSMLKDSFREALDSWVVYVTVAMSCLLFLFLASISYRPVTMQEELESIADKLNFIIRLQTAQNKGLEMSCAIADFEQTNDAVEPWHGDYRFTFVLKVSNPELAAVFDTKKTLREVVRVHFWWLKDVSTTEIVSKDHKDFRISVQSHGTVIEDANSWTNEVGLFFGALPMPWVRTSRSYAVYWLENYLVGGIGATIIVLLSVVVTGFFVPNMMRKGTVDLLLSKPITRPALLLWKYSGGLTFIFLNTAFTVLGVWIILGLRTGIWAYGIWITVPLLTFFFAILYSASTLVAVVTRSTVVSILLTVCLWGVFWGSRAASAIAHPSRQQGVQARATDKAANKAEVRFGDNAQMESGMVLPDWVVTGIDVTHAILPRTGDLAQTSTQILSEGLLSAEERRALKFEDGAPSWLASVGVSAAFIVVMLGLACVRFSLKDY